MVETVITPDTEVKDVEGTVAAEVGKEIITPEPTPSPQTVPLAVYLEMKEDLKALKHEIKESRSSSQSSTQARGVSELAQKYPDVSQEFINDMLNSAEASAMSKIDAKYTPFIEKQENEKRQANFDTAFNNLYEKAVQANPDLPKSMDRELVKELAMTPKYRNVPVVDILKKMYSTEPEGRASSENDMRSSADKVSDNVDFNKVTPDQKQAIMADPAARTKYYTWLDGQTGR